MPVATSPVSHPATSVHLPERRAQDTQREIQLSASDLEILIDNSKPSSAESTQRPTRPCPPPRPSSRAPLRHCAEQEPHRPVLTEGATRLLLLGITVLLWGAMAATAVALTSPTYRDAAARGSLQTVAIQSIEQG